MRLSIIVPCLNEAAYIGQLLSQLQPLRARGHELILVDGGSTDNTLQVAGNQADRLLQCRPGRARQLNHGASAASGDVLWFVHADSSIPADADITITEALQHSMRVWGRFNISLTGPGATFRMIESMMNLRSCLSGIATGDQGIFVLRSAFDTAGGFPGIELMEDIRLSQLLKRQSRPLCLTDKLITSSRRWEKNGILKTILLMWWLRLAFFVGVPAGTLARWYGRETTKPARAALLVFARAPQPGKVKTRLIPVVGENAAASLHADMLEATMRKSELLRDVDIQLWCMPDCTHPLFQKYRTRYGVALHPQSGANLGDRMSQAFATVLKEYEYAVLVGTDCPDLGADDIRLSLDKLGSGCDAVLGPAADGGYVLIGLRRASAHLFDTIQWGSAQVLQATRARLASLGWQWHELAERHDIDRPEDLARYPGLMNKVARISRDIA